MTTPAPEPTTVVKRHALRRVTLLRDLMHELQDEIMEDPERPARGNPLLDQFENVSRSYLAAASR